MIRECDEAWKSVKTGGNVWKSDVNAEVEAIAVMPEPALMLSRPVVHFLPCEIEVLSR